MIALTKLRDLDLAGATGAGRSRHLSAASGLVCLNAVIYVIADDELHLGVFRVDDDQPGDLIRLFEGALPHSKAKRKKHKPDIEALTLLPAHGEHPHGTLLAVGSGSRPNRQRGVMLGLDRFGAVHGTPRVLDLSPLFASLAGEFSELNIEGAVVIGDELRLLQRGSKRHSRNAVIRFKLSAVLDAVGGSGTAAIPPVAIQDVDLGKIGGIPLSFTDAAALPDGRMIFSAVAEDTDNAYVDGRCVGAALGIIGDGKLQRLDLIDRPSKIEGVHARMDRNAIELLLVTDADDPGVPAELFAARMSRSS